MKNAFLLILGTFFCQTTGLAQNEPGNRANRISIYLTGGPGVSHFHYNVHSFNHRIHGVNYKFPAANFRLGLIVEKPISQKFSLRAGLRTGIRIKRNPIYEHFGANVENPRPTAVYPYSFYATDLEVSASNTSFVEIPLWLHYTKDRFKIGVGAIYRAFAVFSDGAASDLGISPNVSYSITDDLRISLEYFRGTRVLLSDHVHNDNGEFIYYDVRDRFVQITFDYKMKIKK